MGKVIRVVAGPISEGDSTKAQAIELLMGLHELKKLGGSNNALVEGDSKVVVSWGSGFSEGVWRLAFMVHEIRDLISSMNITIASILRDQNEIADKVAKWAVGLHGIFISDVMPISLSVGS